MSKYQGDSGNKPTRRQSVFGRVFSNFQFGEKKNISRPSSKEGPLSERELEKTGKTVIAVEEEETTTDSNSTYGNKSLTSTITDVFRRPSEGSSKSRQSSPERQSSTSSAGRKQSFFHSSNPDYDSEQAGSLKHPVPNVPDNRRQSYVPRNAQASFLRTFQRDTPENKDKAKSPTAPSTPNSTRTGHSTPSEIDNNSLTVPSIRRPSGMTSNNIAPRYMRSASNPMKSDGNNPVKSARMNTDQYAQWQNSVNARGMMGQKPGETMTTDEMDAASFRLASRKLSAIVDTRPGLKPVIAKRGRRQTMIDTGVGYRTTDTKNESGGQKNYFIDDKTSPISPSFGVQIPVRANFSRTNSGNRQLHSPTEESDSELESLGFHGAVPV